MGGASELIFLSKTIPKIAKVFRRAAPKWGRRPSFDLRRAPQAGSGGVEAFLGENCPNPRDLSATSPAPEAFLAMPQHVIFAFRFQHGVRVRSGVIGGFQRRARRAENPILRPSSPMLPCWIALDEKRRSRALVSRKPERPFEPPKPPTIIVLLGRARPRGMEIGTCTCSWRRI